jgi:hypothetical protein
LPAFGHVPEWLGKACFTLLAGARANPNCTNPGHWSGDAFPANSGIVPVDFATAAQNSGLNTDAKLLWPAFGAPSSFGRRNLNAAGNAGPGACDGRRRPGCLRREPSK